jgi:glycosyltransferase involved in cell wall biosynthesis
VTASVIVPVLNEARALGCLIGDLRRDPELEIVVVDGGSGDASLAVAAESADQACVEPHGRGAQMRRGAELASGDWLWFLHADSRVAPLTLAAFRTALGSAPGWGFCAVRLASDADSWRSPPWSRGVTERLRLDGAGWMLEVIGAAMNVRSKLTGIGTGDQGIFVHRRLLDAIGGVPAQPLMEDIECCRRLRRLSHPRCLEAPLLTSARRWQRDGVLPTVALMWSLRLRYFLGADPAALARRYYRESAVGTEHDSRRSRRRQPTDLG